MPVLEQLITEDSSTQISLINARKLARHCRQPYHIRLCSKMGDLQAAVACLI